MNNEQEIIVVSADNINEANEMFSKLSADENLESNAFVDKNDKQAIPTVRKISCEKLWNNLRIADMTDIHVLNACKYVNRNDPLSDRFKSFFYAFVIEINYRQIMHSQNFITNDHVSDAVVYYQSFEKTPEESAIVGKPKPNVKQEKSTTRHQKTKPINDSKHCTRIHLKNGHICYSDKIPCYDAVMVNDVIFDVRDVLLNLEDDVYDVHL